MNIDKNKVLEKIDEALKSYRPIEFLRDFVESYYEDDEDRLLISDEKVEAIFGELLGYLDYESIGNLSEQTLKLKRLRIALVNNWSRESVTAALNFDEIEKLRLAVEGGYLDRTTFERKIKALAKAAGASSDQLINAYQYLSRFDK